MNGGGEAGVGSVSCASAGNCAGGGPFTDAAGHEQAFVVSERNGTWGKARQVPGSGALNKGGNAEAFSVSCAPAGNCAAAGVYIDGSGHQQAFVVRHGDGSWASACLGPARWCSSHERTSQACC